MVFLFVVPAASCIAGLANGANGMIWRDVRFEDVSWIFAMRSGGYGPIAHVMFVSAYSLMLAGVALPLIFNFAFIFKIILDWNKDYSSLASALGGFFFSIACLRYGLFSVVPVSRQTIIEQMKVASSHQGLFLTRLRFAVLNPPSGLVEAGQRYGWPHDQGRPLSLQDAGAVFVVHSAYSTAAMGAVE